MTKQQKSDGGGIKSLNPVPRNMVDPIMPCVSPAGYEEYSGGKRIVGLGWLPDFPDHRDFVLGKVKKKNWEKYQDRSGFKVAGKKELPSFCDNLKYCSPIEDQKNLGSCTAQAVVGMVEFMMKRDSGRYLDGSRLFLYKVTRNLMRMTGDTGAYIRSTIKALTAFGVCPEEYAPYNIARFDEEPNPFCYSFASNYKSIGYIRLDPPNQDGKVTLKNLKTVLASEYAVAFGFTVYTSMGGSPDIPYPSPTDSVRGGHAVTAVGYDDNHKVFPESKGSIIIRNSWGRGWGLEGYGFLPYEYVTDQLARDFWVVYNLDWLNLAPFDS